LNSNKEEESSERKRRNFIKFLADPVFKLQTIPFSAENLFNFGTVFILKTIAFLNYCL